jgi:hypothetical protein
MWNVVVGVVLTALLGGLLVPAITTYLSRRREQFNVSRELFEKLASSLWTYWKLAMRVAYYGSKGKERHEDYMAALKAWDSSEAWDNGGQIQIQVSRSKRLLPETTHTTLDEAQQAVVDELDTQVEDLRDRADATAWKQFYDSLYCPKRNEIHRLLFWLDQELNLAEQVRLVRWWWRLSGKTPDPVPGGRPVATVRRSD